MIFVCFIKERCLVASKYSDSLAFMCISSICSKLAVCQTRGLSVLMIAFLSGMKIKQMEQKYCTGLPRVKFLKGIRKRRSTAKELLKVKIGKFAKNPVPSDSEDAPADWHDLMPSLPSSPEVETFIDRLNQEHEAAALANTPPHSPPPEATIGETLQMLDVPPAEDQPMGSPRPLPLLHTPPRSPFKEGMTEDLPLPDLPTEEPANIEVSFTTENIVENIEHKECSQEEPISPVESTLVASGPQVTAETVSTSGTPPPAAIPKFPTAAKKCPRKEFRGKSTKARKGKETHQKPKWLTALHEIKLV